MSMKCPYAEGLDCDLFYRYDECYFQNRVLGLPKNHGAESSSECGACTAKPDMCSRYQDYKKRSLLVQHVQSANMYQKAK